jgi:hypothetical protein
VDKILCCKSASDIAHVLKHLLSAVQKTNKKSLIQKFNNRHSSLQSCLLRLHKQLTDPLLSYFELVDHDIDEVIDIFVRVNSGGMQLKKADLLFSIIAAEWEEAKDKIDTLLRSLERYDLNVDRDFLMRSALMLCDLPIKYKVETFSKRNIQIIINNWEVIEAAILKLAESLNNFGYKNFPNLSNYALIPIAYYISKSGDIKTQASIKNIKLYYVTAQVKNIFGGQNDIILGKIRDVLRVKNSSDYKLQSNKFDIESIKDMDLPVRKSFKIDKTYIEEELAEESYGANAYFLLSLLYPTVDFKMKRYELDHIHPRKRMNLTNLKTLGLQETDINWIMEHYNNLPNLELLTSADNIEKKAKPFKEFIITKNRRDKTQFLKDNILPTERTLWELENFKEFYEWRRKLIVRKLAKVFA